MNFFEFIGFRKKTELPPEETTEEKMARLYPNKLVMPDRLRNALEREKKYSEITAQEKIAKVKGIKSTQSRIDQLKSELEISEDGEKKKKTGPLEIGPL